MADGDSAAAVVLGAVVLGLALTQCGGAGSSGADEAPGSASDLSAQVGERLTLAEMRVESVPADEGFWLDSADGRMWVQIDTVSESPYTVRPGDAVSFTGEVVAHDRDFPASVGVTRPADAGDLARQAAHLRVALDDLSIR